ncbi:hypothetical protein DFJ73DRAFT_584113 [Zopfochytrium polystomum]|nr:hypothetical protein DFJ73DRAFT_584113 [Zopfochytrium polystomum]
MPFSSLISKTATPHVFLTAGGVYFVAFSLVRHFVPLLFAAQAPPLAFALDWDPAAVRGYTQADLAAAASTQFLASPAGQAALLTTAGLHVL